MKRLSGWMGGLAAVTVAILAWTWHERSASQTDATVFTTASGCAIVIPRDSIDAERRAANLLRSTLAKASGLPENAFPVVTEGAATTRDGLFVGATRRGIGFLQDARKPPFDTAVGCAVANGALVLRSERRESCEIAAAWFLQTFADAHWFIPGPFGEVIPLRAELIVPAGKTVARPGFLSRSLGGIGGPEGRDWYARNRLEARFHHSHNLDNIFKPDVLRKNPEMAPMRYGRRYFPLPGDYNWQPDLTSPAAIAHAAAVANRAFADDPNRISFSLSENDSARFDVSPQTLQVVSPPRFFRTRPDYSDLVFGFANAVAERVARVHPDRWLPTYAYYWAEDTPRFPVARNVIPYLTADRAQWFDPAFAAEDKELIARWSRSGAEIIGVYDYFYGAPFLIPRPILTAVAESIPFEHRAGIRAFYAETSPNWALDGPKAWLAAQLLWDLKRDPDALLETYYREFWAEAAEPMRRFDALCERAWLEQPRPGYWIKYFQDEQQTLLFPPDVRAGLRDALAEARQLARTPQVQARVEFVAAGWTVAESFIEFCAARDRLGRTIQAGEDARAIAADWLKAAETRRRFLEQNAAVRERQPLALAPQKIDMYLRNDPSGRATRALIGSELGRQFLQANAALRVADATTHELARLFEGGRHVLVDAGWHDVARKRIGGSADFEWIELGGHWQASGEPAEKRKIAWLGEREVSAESGERPKDRRQTMDGGGQTTDPAKPVAAGTNHELTTTDSAKRLRFDGCRQEFLVQWLPTKPDTLYAAQIDVRAKVSPGNQTFLIVNFLDEKLQRVGGGHLDRLAADSSIQQAQLCVVARAPSNARYVGFGIRVIHQVNDDFAEFSGASLRRLEK